MTNGTTYFYVVRAVDVSGNEGAGSLQASAAPVDNGPPAAPTNFSAADRAGDQGGAINLSWSANADPDLAGYRLSRATIAGGPYTPVGAGLLTGTSVVDSGLSNGTTYYYVLRAVDASGNESANSNEASAIPADNLAPAAPAGAAATDRPGDQGGAVDVTWTVSTSADVVGYAVYRSATSGGP